MDPFHFKYEMFTDWIENGLKGHLESQEYLPPLSTSACSYEQFKEYLEKVLKVKTFYDRITIESISMFENTIPIKLVSMLKDNNGDKYPGAFFFAYRYYDMRAAELKSNLNHQFAKLLGKEPEFKITSILQVGVGYLYGLVVKGAFIRIVVTSLKPLENKISYWSVDNGTFGDCIGVDQLYFLNDSSCSMPIIAVPGVFETPPTRSQLAKFKSHCYVLASRIQEPVFRDDYGPRKIVLH